MSDLIERIEGALGPDSQLDCLIAVAASKEPTARVAYMAGRRWYKKPGAGRIAFAGAFGNGAALGIIFQAHRYTTSIDAAMMLVDPMWLAKVGELWDGDRKSGWARVALYTRVADGRTFWDADFDAVAATPALALCAASLKASAHRSDCLARYGEDIFGDGK